MAGTESKNNARDAVKKAFTSLKENVTDTKSASEILKEFIKTLIGLRSQVKKDSGKETILGKYLKGDNIIGADKSPISRAVNEFLSGTNTVFENKAFVTSDGKIDKAISSMQNNVATKLDKCKRLKSADVLAAMYHVVAEKEKDPVLRLLILGEMFTELGKANGFIKGNQEGVPEGETGAENSQNEEKDNKNKHLGTLATKKLRSLAATIGKKIKDLFENADWLTTEENTVDSYTESPKTGNSGTNEEPKTPRAKAIEMQQADNARKTYLNDSEGKDKTALNPALAPREKDAGKYMKRDLATEDQLKAFLKNSGSVIKFIDLKSYAKDDAEFRKALSKKYKINGEYVSLRAILNALAALVYNGNTLIQVVASLPADPAALDSLLTMVEEKLKRSHAKDARREEINNELKDWITVINVVNECTRTIEVTYDPTDDYDTMFAKEVNKLKNTKISVIAEGGTKLEEKEIEEVLKTEIEVESLTGLADQHKKRLKSLQVAYKDEIKYGEMYKAICAFIDTPNAENLGKARIKIVKKNDGRLITKDNWNKSKAFDDFVADAGAPISQIAEKKKDQKTLPPVGGTARDSRLVLSEEASAFTEFDASNEWFGKPTMENCRQAIEGLLAENYLGNHIDLLKALNGTNDREYVLGIKLASFVKSWVKLAEGNLGGTKLTEGTNYVTGAEGATPLKPTDWLTIHAKIGATVQGYTVEEVNAFVDFVTKNSSADFCEVTDIKDTEWGNLMNGHWSLLVKADPEAQTLATENKQFKLEDKKRQDDEATGENEEKQNDN